MRTPNLKALRMFDVAARRLNFRLASEDLNVTQGAVAQQVRKLEQDLGLRLFRRKARGLALTSAGQAYHAQIRRAFDIIDEATRNLHPKTPRTTLSVTPSFASKWLMPRLAGFAEVNPGIALGVVASEAVSDLRSADVDIAVRFGAPPFGSDLRWDFLAPEELCAVCAPNHAATAAKIAAPPDFIALPLVEDGHDAWAALFAQHDLPQEPPVMQVNHTALAVDAAVAGRGVALAARMLVKLDIEAGRLIELWRDDRAERGGYYAVRMNRGDATAPVEVVTSWLLSETASERAGAS